MGAVKDDGAVSGFSGGALHAVPDAACQNDSATDAGTEGVHEERADGVGTAGAEEAFAVGSEGGVVADVDGAAEAMLEFGAEVEAVEAGEIRRMMEDTEGQLNGSGAADADAKEFAGLFFDELADSGGHVVEDGLWAGSEACGKADVVEAFAFLGDSGDAEIGAAEVDADGEGWHGDGRKP